MKAARILSLLLCAALVFLMLPAPTLAADAAPKITSANMACFTLGKSGSFTVTATGSPTPALSKTGDLPGGLTFIDNGNGTATLSGTPAEGTFGNHLIAVTASNGVSPAAAQYLIVSIVAQYTTALHGADISVTPLDRGHGEIFVALPFSQAIAELNTDGTLVGMLTAQMYGPMSLAMDGYGFTAFVANHANGTVTRVIINNEIYGTDTVGSVDSFPVALALDQYGGAWVVLNGDDTVVRLGAMAYGVDFTHSVGRDPRGIAIGPWSNECAWITNFKDNTVTKLTPLWAPLYMATSFTEETFSVGRGPCGIAIDDSGAVWVANSTDNTVTRLTPDGDTYSSTTINVGSAPMDIAIDSSGYVFVTNNSGNTVTQLSPDGAVVGTFGVTSEPRAIAIDLSGNAWVAGASITKFQPIKLPEITSANGASFAPGGAGSFTVTAAGSPAPALSVAGALPGGVTFTDNGDGTGTLSGTPAAGTGGSYPLTITAANGASPSAAQSFMLTVPTVDAAIDPATVVFDKNPAKRVNVSTTVTWNSATCVEDVKARGASIGLASYEVVGNTLTVFAAYLATQDVGSLEMSVEFDIGGPAVLSVAISDTTPIQLAVPANLAWDAATPGKATWDAVPNAARYSVRLYKGSDALGSALDAAGTEHDFTAAIAAAGSGSYTFKVTAIGDGTAYTNSEQSAASAAYDYVAPIYAVTFVNQGAVYASRSVQMGAFVGDGWPDDPARLGYTFGGWYTETDGGGTETTAAAVLGITADQTLYAAWTPHIYTVKYEANGGDGGSTADSAHTYDTAKALTGNGFSHTGYTFAGWAESTTGAVKYADKASVVNLTAMDGATITLYAVWTANVYTVTFDAQGGSVSLDSMDVIYDSTYGPLPVPTRTGYTFGGWFTEVDGSGTRIAAATTVKITGEQTLYAAWAPHAYTVTYDANGGDGGDTADSAHTYGTTKALTGNGFSRTGYTFAGWAASAGGAAVYSNEQSVVNLTAENGATVTLYAAWTPHAYTVEYEANGGAGTTGDSAHTYDIEKALTANGFSRIGYNFAGWATSAGGAVVYSDKQSVVNLSATDGATVTLHAKWTLISYTISYTLGSGGAALPANPASYTIESDAITLNNPTRAYYTFAGWSGPDIEDGAMSVTIPKGSIGDRSYTALWTADSYPITYDLDGGTPGAANPASYTIDSEAITLNNPTKPYYTFVGWSGTGITGTSASVTIPTGSTGHRAYTAHWKEAFVPRTLTDPATGVSVSGLIREDASLIVGNMALGNDAACRAIRQRMNDAQYVFLLGWDISLTQHFTGTLTIAIPVGSRYNGMTVTLLHCANGALESFSCVVRNGVASVSVASLSPFAAFALTEDVAPDRLPVVATKAASGITASGATLNGTVAYEGAYSVIERGFVCTTSASGGLAIRVAASGKGKGSFSAVVSGLTPYTTYYVRAYATNAAGTAYGTAVSLRIAIANPAYPPQTGDSDSGLAAGTAMFALGALGGIALIRRRGRRA